MHVRWATGLLILALCATATTASAGPTVSDGSQPTAADIATARELYREAAALAEEGKWEEALATFQKSMDLRPSGLTRYSIAVAQENVGQLVEAMENLRVFLRQAKDRESKRYIPAAKELIRSIEGRLARLKVVVPGDPRGAQVFVDGEPLPTAAIGVERVTNPGTHKIEARIPGYPTFNRDIVVSAGGRAEVVVKLESGTEHPEAAPVQPKPSEPDSSARTTGVVLAITGGVVLATGATLGILGYTKANSSETSDGSDADSAKKMALIGDIAMGTGLVVAGVGAYLILTNPSREAEPSTALAPWAGPRSGGLVWQGRF